VHTNVRTTTWSRGGMGHFLMTVEDGAGGSLKHTILTYDPGERLYRGCFLEPSASGFSEGRWNSRARTMQTIFFLFDLPLDDEGRPDRTAAFSDGINGAVTRKVVKEDVALLAMELKFGDTVVWAGAGEDRRPLDPGRIRHLVLASHPGKAIVAGEPFRAEPGWGVHLRLGQADRALAIFADGDTVRRADAPELALHVSYGKFEVGADVLLWHPHGNRYNAQEWQLRDDGAVSPVRAPQLVLGWQEGALHLVAQEDESRLVFAELQR
jgi:hypothetical protein